MNLISLVPLTKAATFTLGCVLLQTGKVDQDRVSVALGATMVLLSVSLLMVLTSDGIDIDPNALDPAWARPTLPFEVGTR